MSETPKTESAAQEALNVVIRSADAIAEAVSNPGKVKYFIRRKTDQELTSQMWFRQTRQAAGAVGSRTVLVNEGQLGAYKTVTHKEPMLASVIHGADGYVICDQLTDYQEAHRAPSRHADDPEFKATKQNVTLTQLWRLVVPESYVDIEAKVIPIRLPGSEILAAPDDEQVASGTIPR